MKTYTFSYLMLVLFLVACGEKSTDKQVENQKINSVNNLSQEQEPEQYPKFKRIVCLGERVIEAVYALGDSSKIVAIDRSYDTFPYLEVPKVGNKSVLRARYVLKHKPDAVFMEEDAANEEEIQKIKEKNIPCFVFKKGQNADDVKAFITSVSKKLNRSREGKRLITEFDADLRKVQKIIQKQKDSLRVLYVHALGTQAMMFAGSETLSDHLLRLCGAKNAAFDYEGMERLSQDEMAYLNPDYILLNQSSIDSFEGKIYEATPLTSSFAYRMGRIIVLDKTESLNFGVHTGRTALKIAELLYKKQVYNPLPFNPQYDNDASANSNNSAPVISKPSTEIEIIEQN